jgi:hypothetical protein
MSVRKCFSMVDLSTSLGLAVFSSALTASIVLYSVDSQERINLNLPFGQTIPWTIALVGAGIFAFAEQGVIGIMSTIASAIFIGAIIKATNKLRTNPEES